jgi:outer membrane protein assembly factor BamB
VRYLAITARLAGIAATLLAAREFPSAASTRIAPLALPFAPAWSRQYQGSAPVIAAVSDSGWLVAGFDDHIEFLSLATGESAGRLPLPTPQLACDDTTCVSADDRVIRSIDVGKRTVRWQKQVSGPLAFPPTLRNGWVFFATTDGHVQALRDVDGAPVWTYEARAPLTGQLAVDGGHIAIATENGDITLIDVLTGHRVWLTTLPAGRPGTPTLGGGMVLVGTDNRELLFVGASDGALKDSQRNVAAINGMPTLDERFFYICSDDGVLRAYDRRGRALKWYADLPTRPANVGPVSSDGLTIVALRTGAFQVYLSDGDGKRAAAAIPAPTIGESAAVLPIPPMITGSGASTRLVTISVSVGDSSNWSAAVTAGGAALDLTAQPTVVPGRALTLSTPQ